MKRILFVIALVAIAVIEFLLWINALVDGKYLVEGSGVEDVYNLRVESLFCGNVRKLRNCTSACLLSDFQKEEMKDPDARKHRGPLTFLRTEKFSSRKSQESTLYGCKVKPKVR